MKDLTTEEMSSLKGGQPFNVAALISAGNVALAIPIAVNVSGDQTANQDNATALAGNQTGTAIAQAN
jgi:hypothetical protein